MEGVQGEQQGNRPGHPGHTETGRGELEEQAVDANQHEHQGHLRVGQDAEQVGAPVRLHPDHCGPGGGEFVRAGEDRDLAAVQLSEQFRQVHRHQVDHLLFQGLSRTQAGRLGDRAHGEIHVAAAQLRQAADVGSGVLHRLGAHGVLFLGFFRLRVRLGARPRAADADGNRRGRAQVGGRGHGRDVAGIEDVGAGAGRAGALRGDKGGHRHGRGEDVLDHRPHGGVEPAGRVHLDDHQAGAGLGRPLETSMQVVRGGRADGAVNAEHEDIVRCRVCRRPGEQGEQHQQRENQQAEWGQGAEVHGRPLGERPAPECGFFCRPDRSRNNRQYRRPGGKRDRGMARPRRFHAPQSARTRACCLVILALLS